MTRNEAQTICDDLARHLTDQAVRDLSGDFPIMPRQLGKRLQAVGAGLIALDTVRRALTAQ